MLGCKEAHLGGRILKGQTICHGGVEIMQTSAAIDARIKIKTNNKEIKTNENSPARLIKIKTNNKLIKTNENPARRPVYLAAYQSINSTNGGAGLFPPRAHSPPGTRYSESRSGPPRSVEGKGSRLATPSRPGGGGRTPS